MQKLQQHFASKVPAQVNELEDSMITPWSDSLKCFFGFPKRMFEHRTVAHNRETRVGHFPLVPVLSPTLADKLMLDVNTLVLVPSTAANGNMLKLCTI